MSALQESTSPKTWQKIPDTHGSRLETLPLELLQKILKQLCNADERPTPWLVSVASQSRRLREAAEFLLFRTLSIDLGEPGHNRTRTVLDFLTQNYRLASYVKTLEINCSYEDVGPTILDQLTVLMSCCTNLKSIVTSGYPNDFNAALERRKPTFGIAFNSSASWRTWDMGSLGVTWLNRFKNLPSITALSVVTRDVTQLQTLFDLQPRLHGLAIITKDLSSGDVCPDVPNAAYEPSAERPFNIPPLVDLRIEGFLGLRTLSSEDEQDRCVNERIAFLNCIHWDFLQSLELNGGVTTERFLTHYGDRLSGLRILSLWPYKANDVLTDYPPAIEATSRFLEKSPCARRLKSLYLSGYPQQFSLTSLESSALQSLRLCNFQSLDRATSSLVRPVSDIYHLARHCPSLVYLAIDCPDLSSMFHPTLTPGIDVNLPAYPFLEAVASLPNLSHLHLLPPYRPQSPTNSSAAFSQPFTDDSHAVRLFTLIKSYQAHHRRRQEDPKELLREQCKQNWAQSLPTTSSAPGPGNSTESALALSTATSMRSTSLTHLHISSTFLFTRQISDPNFSPRTWVVYQPSTPPCVYPAPSSFPQPLLNSSASADICKPSSSTRVFVTVRQVGHDYEDRQIWEGESLVRTETRQDRGFSRVNETGFPDGIGSGG